MTRKFEDLVEDEVRRRLSERLVSAGLNSGRLSLEVLYLLPAEFVREYQELFWRALREDLPGSNTGQGKDEGRLKRSVPSKLRGTKKGMADYSGGGGNKKYKVHWLVKDEEALKLKTAVDRKLIRAVQAARRDLENGLVRGSAGEGDSGQRDSDSGLGVERDKRGRFRKTEGE